MAINSERVSFDVPMDIIYDILSRLPGKTLIRFKSVCRVWHHLIENPNFIETQQNTQSNLGLNSTFNAMFFNTNKPLFLHFSEATHNLIDFKLPSNLSGSECYVVGICNGLVCASSSLDSSECIIFNPTTRKSRQISPFKLPISPYDVIFSWFGLHVNGYELIRIIYSPPRWRGNHNPIIRAEMYTMCNECWREIDVKLGAGRLRSRQESYPQPILVDGVLYWKAEYCYGEPRIASFDISNEVFQVIETPFFEYFFHRWHLLEIKNRLAVVIYHDVRWFALWLLDDDKVTWKEIPESKNFSHPSDPHNCDGIIRVLGCSRKGKLTLEQRYGNNIELLMYDLDRNEVKSLHNVDVEGSIDATYLPTESSFPFTASLAPVN